MKEVADFIDERTHKTEDFGSSMRAFDKRASSRDSGKRFLPPRTSSSPEITRIAGVVPQPSLTQSNTIPTTQEQSNSSPQWTKGARPRPSISSKCNLKTQRIFFSFHSC
jgi:hypothetical protein